MNGLRPGTRRKIYLLITNLVMPEMNGRHLAKNLLSIYPDISCVFMSSYATNAIAKYSMLGNGLFQTKSLFSMKAPRGKAMQGPGKRTGALVTDITAS